jgi:hypothetical protein
MRNGSPVWRQRLVWESLDDQTGSADEPAASGTSEDAERAALSASRPNVLLIGAESPVRCTLDRLLPRLLQPIRYWYPRQQLVLSVPNRISTLVLHDVDWLPVEDQLRLYGWLRHASWQPQIISTTSAPLVPLLEYGAFDERLFYRLNTVCLELDDPKSGLAAVSPGDALSSPAHTSAPEARFRTRLIGMLARGWFGSPFLK